tara:strand:- start:12 stop:470 length:459 start_codon:yes stop_codon:yes gene_type:complete
MESLVQIREEGLRALSLRKFHPQDHAKTYGKLFEMFKKSTKQDQFLKLIWAHNVKWDGDPFELAKIAPDECPIFKTPLDYGRGFNKVTNPNIDNFDGFFQPTVDHRLARSLGGKDTISNYVIVSRKANQFKSDMGSKEELDVFYKGMTETFW